MPVLTLGGAQRAARAALAECRRQGYDVTVVVLDRDGVDMVVLRDEDATGATVATARGKAYASAGFQSPSSALEAGAADRPGLTTVPGFVILAGALPIKSGPTTIGAIGVSGAPGGDLDEGCATVGLGAL
jgi:uncharacterized protein GlcG (DUF336 family)